MIQAVFWVPEVSAFDSVWAQKGFDWEIRRICYLCLNDRFIHVFCVQNFEWIEEKVVLEILQNSQENACNRDSSLIKLQASKKRL